MMEITNSDAGTLYIQENDKLHFRIIKNKSMNVNKTTDDEIDLPPVILNKGNIENVCAFSAINNEIIVVDDVYTSDKFNFKGPRRYDEITGYRTQSMLVLPLTTYWNKNVEVLGVIQLINAIDPETGEITTYNDIESPPIIPSLANVAANSLANFLRLNEIRMLFQAFVSAMVKTIDARSQYNSNHTQKVTQLCVTFADFLTKKFPHGHFYHFDDIRKEELVMAAMLHDIGKITTPIHIMDKADRLGERFSLIMSRFELKKLQIENAMLKKAMSGQQYKDDLELIYDAQETVKSASKIGYLTDDLALKVQLLSGIKYENPEGKSVHLLDACDLESLSVRKGTLTKDEREIMEEHVVITQRILQNIAFKKYYKNVGKWAASHHEFIDG